LLIGRRQKAEEKRARIIAARAIPLCACRHAACPLVAP
jgi:hypothetical protein